MDYFNIALDKVPESHDIGIGSIILFPQGGYRAGATQLTGYFHVDSYVLSEINLSDFWIYNISGTISYL